MKKLLWLCMLILVVAGCSNNQAKNEKEELTIMLDWYPNAVHSALYTAQEKGYFDEEGLDVKIEMPADTNDPLKLAATGKVDLAISYQTQLLLSRGEDIPVVSIGAYVRHSLDGIMYKKGNGIESPKDLVGKNVGYPSSSVSEAILNTMVKQDGGDPEQVKLTDVGWDLMPSLATDKVDALVGAYVNHELVLLKKEGYDVGMFPLSEYGVPDNYELVVVTGEKTLDKKEESIKKFWNALSKAQADVKADPDAALDVLFSNENESFPLDRDVETESLNTLLPLMEDESVPFGYQEEKAWQDVADWLYDNKVLKEKVEVKEAYKNIVTK
ncbi:transporter substrate-binding domain-containing protein [Robertmurraya yapensis]|uniref:Transporter substrate-binding domain-containing protein n=1 Tax=Bacillus yapensis TaxID=2492960 RepID=A0A431WEA4_9BACI|nr:ABC transporter substrate-binding protein [Bacillus yapensis]RTR33906.1 transporter substrate-binding domain-containing protein [Bacillus yapensis]TKS97224.1 transporter substrate-binding domain-containing protein [Bacillus yapensis]